MTGGVSDGKPILTLNLRATAGGGVVLIMFNASDNPRSAVVSSALVQIGIAHLCDIAGAPREQLEVRDGTVEVPVPPRQTVLLEIQRA